MGNLLLIAGIIIWVAYIVDKMDDTIDDLNRRR